MRWPTKLKKFGIEDPFLRIVVTKYENEIPWQTQVRDQASLQIFVAEQMLPGLLARVAYPPRSGVKHHYISSAHVDLELALTTDQELDRDDIERIRLIRDEDGTAAAVEALVEVINTRKARGFQEWIDFLAEHCAGQAAFHLLLLRPLFDMAGRGSRRTVVPPVKAVVDWLARGIDQGRFTPAEHVGRTYCWKLGAGGQRLVVDGWQYIAPGVENAPQLSAAARGSGWCVASLEWAELYLQSNCFYVLRSAASLVVALRADFSGRTVVECQGRGNSRPTGWYAEIDLFVSSQGLSLETWRDKEVAAGVAEEGHYQLKSKEWWSERIRYWPFAAWLAPDNIRQQFGELSSDAIGAYMPFPCFGELSRQAGLSMSAKDWAAVVEIEPRRFDDVPTELREQEEVRAACLTGWRYLVSDDELTLAEISLVPNFVRADTEMSCLIEETFMGEVRQLVRQPKNAKYGRHGYDLGSILPPNENDSTDLAVERVLNLLLNNTDGDFSDERFPECLTKRVDFQQVRRRAWQEAFAAHPPLWFALPKDLKGEADFTPLDTANVGVDLEAWVRKVRERPWILTQQKGVPETVRFHRRILEAYRDGWLPHLRSHPYRLWAQPGHHRGHMSLGLLYDPAVIDALTAGWKARRDTAHIDWRESGWTSVPIMQAAVLRGMGTPDQIENNVEAMAVCSDIRSLQHEVTATNWSSRYVEEVRGKLASVGIHELIEVHYTDLGFCLSSHREDDKDIGFWEWVMCIDPETEGFRPLLAELKCLSASELAEKVFKGYDFLSGKIEINPNDEVDHVIAVEGLGFAHSGYVCIEFPESQDENSVVIQDFSILLKIGYRHSFSQLSESRKHAIRREVGSLDWFQLVIGDWGWRRLSNSGIVVSVVSDIPLEIDLRERFDLLNICPVLW